ncbi:MAG: gephyrin-like molybdotransferase Glp [Planctomycetota bacterium]
MKPIAQALAEMLPAFRPLGAERVALLDALSRVLAEDVVARADSPPFDNSAMDGYAVRSADLVAARADSPVRLPLAGESKAGDAAPPALLAGRAIRIFTGAPLPAGADAVEMQEQVEREGDVAVLRAPVPAGQHVRPRAEDLAVGLPMLGRGTVLGPGELGLLASQGYAAVSVARRPRVAILSTGDELRDVSDAPRPGSIVNSNAYALAAQVREAGGDPWILPNTRDVLDEVVARVREGLTADVLLTIGGVSVGEYDLVKDAFAAAGVTPAFWQVAIKPGKPLSFGTHGERVVVGLPGNPVSAMVTFEVFVRPGLRAMLGDPRPHRRPTHVRLAAAHRHRTGRTELVRAALADAPGGLPAATLNARQGSGSLTSMVAVDALVILPAERERFEEGEVLDALRLDDPRGSAASPF